MNSNTKRKKIHLKKKPDDSAEIPGNSADEKISGDPMNIQIKEEVKEKVEKEEKKGSQNDKGGESDEESDKTPKRSRSQNSLFPTPLTATHKSKRTKKK